MRPSLHLLTDRRRHGILAPRRTSGPAPRPRGPEPATHARPAEAPAAPPADLRDDLLAPDRDFSRAREAGGPEDYAHYTCACGCVFEAGVSTTVACPHCGTAQAW